MTANCIKIVGITETWLTPDDNDCRFLCKNTHNIFRKDRLNGIHGGVALLICKKYKSVEVTFAGITELEYVCARIISNRTTFYVATVYKPSCMQHAHLLDDVERLLTCLDNTKCPYLLLGDFNLPDIDWSIPVCTDHRGKQDQFLSLFSSYSLSQKVLLPTRKQNTLDLIFENQAGLILNTDTDAPLTKESDHNIVTFQCVLDPTESSQDFFRDWKNADFTAMSHFLDMVSWTVLFQDCATVNDKWRCFCSVMETLLDLFVPLKKSTNSFCSKKFPKEIRNLLSKKRQAFKKLRSNPSTELREKCDTLRPGAAPGPGPGAGGAPPAPVKRSAPGPGPGGFGKKLPGAVPGAKIPQKSSFFGNFWIFFQKLKKIQTFLLFCPTHLSKWP